MILDITNDTWVPKKDKNKFIRTLGKDILELKTSIHKTAEEKHRPEKGQQLKDGFVSTTIALHAEQTITYKTLKDFFERATISIIE